MSEKTPDVVAVGGAAKMGFASMARKYWPIVSFLIFIALLTCCFALPFNKASLLRRVLVIITMVGSLVLVVCEVKTKHPILVILSAIMALTAIAVVILDFRIEKMQPITDATAYLHLSINPPVRLSTFRGPRPEGEDMFNSITTEKGFVLLEQAKFHSAGYDLTGDIEVWFHVGSMSALIGKPVEFVRTQSMLTLCLMRLPDDTIIQTGRCSFVFNGSQRFSAPVSAQQTVHGRFAIVAGKEGIFDR